MTHFKGVIKMIKAYFHSSNVRVIIFHKFRWFIPAREHLFKVLSWNAVTFFLVLILLIPESYPLLQCVCLFIVTVLAPQMTVASCGPPPTPPCPPYSSPGPWNFPDTQFPAQQAIPLTVERL
jgi:hypothetical protein